MTEGPAESEGGRGLPRRSVVRTARLAGLPVSPPARVATLRGHFDDDQLLERTHLIALENLRGRFSLALGVGAARFSDGMVCAVPANAPCSTPESVGARPSGR